MLVLLHFDLLIYFIDKIQIDQYEPLVVNIDNFGCNKMIPESDF